MSGANRDFLQGTPPSVHAKQRQAGSGSMFTFGCLAALLGMLLACGLLGIVFLFSMGGDTPQPPAPNPDQPDIVITVHESYFADLMRQSLPEEWSKDVKIDLEPGNKIKVSGKVKGSIFGQTIEGDVSSTVILNAENGKLTITTGEIQAFGFGLSGIGKNFTDKIMGDVNNLVNQTIKDGLGENAYIMSVSSDSEYLTIKARFPQ